MPSIIVISSFYSPQILQRHLLRCHQPISLLQWVWFIASLLSTKFVSFLNTSRFSKHCCLYCFRHLSKSPTDQPTKATPNPTPPPTNPPVPEQTYCGCPQCTAAIWNTDACDSSGCYTCGGRITFKQSFEGGSLPESEACAFVSNEFPGGPCGPVCNPESCVSESPTKTPTLNPTTLEPTKSPSIPTTSPTQNPITVEPTKSPSAAVSDGLGLGVSTYLSPFFVFC